MSCAIFIPRFVIEGEQYISMLYYLNASEICPDKAAFWQEWSKRSLIIVNVF